MHELSSFVEELARVAPLWNPDLNDGAIINYAPLWRITGHTPWRRNIKGCWDSLCAGEYDWSHLAMHLWPERVVPKCAADRSLAIAHGLEDVFWLAETDGKWKPRSAPTRPVDELVLERSSLAVKAALKGVLEAPSPDCGHNESPTGKDPCLSICGLTMLDLRRDGDGARARLNLITGDNGLGKSFLLDVAWWCAHPEMAAGPQ